MYLGTESSMTEAKLTISHIARSAGVNIEDVARGVPPKRFRSQLRHEARPQVGVKNESADAGVSPMLNPGVKFKVPTY